MPGLITEYLKKVLQRCLEFFLCSCILCVSLPVNSNHVTFFPNFLLFLLNVESLLGSLHGDFSIWCSLERFSNQHTWQFIGLHSFIIYLQGSLDFFCLISNHSCIFFWIISYFSQESKSDSCYIILTRKSSVLCLQIHKYYTIILFTYLQCSGMFKLS